MLLLKYLNIPMFLLCPIQTPIHAQFLCFSVLCFAVAFLTYFCVFLFLRFFHSCFPKEPLALDLIFTYATYYSMQACGHFLETSIIIINNLRFNSLSQLQMEYIHKVHTKMWDKLCATLQPLICRELAIAVGFFFSQLLSP